MKLLDLFSGIGGFSLGLESAGFETVAFCEISAPCRRLLNHHWPQVPIYDDIKTLAAERLASDGIAIDAICGGFPCQDISYAGKGAGLAGERSGLWTEYARLIGELRHRVVIVENVPALLSRGLGAVLGDLAALGYDAVWDCIPASALGAPHRRDRVWIIAYPGSIEHEGRGDEIRRQIAARLYGILADAACERQQERRNVRCGQSTQRASGGGQTMADADRSQRQGNSRAIGIHPQHADPWGASWWQSEPDVGRSLDGFSIWLDGLDLTEPHKLLMAYANAKKIRPREIMPTLRNAYGEGFCKRKNGRSRVVSSQEILFAYVCKLKENSLNKTRIQLESEKTFKNEMRSVWACKKPASTSCGPKHSEQQSRKHSDAVHALPYVLARYAEKAWLDYRRSNASDVFGWEEGISRVANNVPARVDRLHGIGNAVVPQIPRILGQAIIATFS